MSLTEQVQLVETLQISRDELIRARRRVGEPQWQAAAENLRQAAEKALVDDAPLPAMETAWYDADPSRDFGQTYIPFHHFLRPVTDVALRGNTLARAAMIFDEPRYRAKACELFLYIIRRIKCHVRHHDSGMEYGRLAVQMTELYLAVKDQLAEADRQLAEAKFVAMAEATLEGTQHWLTVLKRMPYSNHLAFQRHGLLCVGLLLGRDDWISEAIDGHRGFGEMLSGATFDDGLCYESSTLYHYATLHGLLHMAELVRHRPALGRDLYRESFANGRTLKQMIEAPLGMLLPAGELPTVGDCYARRAAIWDHAGETYELGYAVYGDPQFAWVLERSTRSGQAALLHGVEQVGPSMPPGGRTRVWVRHGYHLLTAAESVENYWDKRSTAPAAFVSTDRNGIHHHIDRLGLQMSAAGRVWLEDVESHAVASEGHGFVNRIQEGFNRTTPAHNLVVVDQKNQNVSNEPLRLLDLKDLPGLKTLTVADSDGVLYDGVQQRRSVAVTAEYLLDVYEVDCGAEERTCDLALHPRADGDAAARLCGREPAFVADAPLPTDAPYAFLRDVRSADVAAMKQWPAAAVALPLEILWRQGDGVCAAQVGLLEGQAERLISARWPLQSDWQTGGRQLLFVRGRGRRVTFVAVYQVRLDGGNAAAWHVESAERYFNGLEHEIRIRMGNGAVTRLHVV